jgi:hypothetical protein
LEREIRDLINAPRRHQQLRANSHAFSQLCSSLDVIGDTELALEAYLAGTRGEECDGDLYLRIYGVLQVLVVQQDALVHVADAVQLALALSDDVKEIREIRNDAIGHPTRRGEAPGSAFNYISRPSLSPGGFELMTLRPGGAPEHRTIDIASLIATQRSFAIDALQRTIQHEREREAQHREQFRSARLQDAFPDWLGHTFEKIGEDIRGTGIGVGAGMVSSVEKAIAAFEHKLTERQELPALLDAFQHSAKPARHAAARLREYLAGRIPELSAEDAEAFLFRLSHAIAELRSLARELDETYDRDAMPGDGA